ncbi:MAG TPA: glycosyltransferase family 4 protein [Tahibacter sp.]|uniref:MraY family glycosyltransferase n=1 Tax=Tahibacter sp. TaxID=2056211 RepID=UPI002BEC1386|nr:glycosyltransferase family 4 protein [Tahibacter sp.]HSX62679.1 glycosyltransferase family 4 protein [Tahibacter sp.]
MDTTLALRVVQALLVAAAATALAIRYARRRRLLDQPGQRRSHSVPTARGGGIAIVAAVLGCAGPLLDIAPLPGLLLATSLILVAAIGWWDDHAALSARARIAVQIPAAVLLAAVLYGLVPSSPDLPASIALLGLIVLSTVWSINLHNFMDGINGLLTLQSAYVFGMAALLGRVGLEHGLNDVPAILAAACLGFLPFNFPRARIFLGDVGSGALGLLIAAVLWWAALREPRWIAAGLLLVSAFAIDATATLLQRFWRGRRWYSAHREHLYQWLVRSGGSHARVVSYYMAWNLLLAAPLALLVATSRSVGVAAATVVLTYAAGIALWCRARRAVLAGVRRHA